MEAKVEEKGCLNILKAFVDYIYDRKTENVCSWWWENKKFCYVDYDSPGYLLRIGLTRISFKRLLKDSCCIDWICFCS